MARPYSDDLRRKILETYAQGEVTLEQLAKRFRVSYGYVKKLRRQQLRHQKMERVRHQPGRKPKLTEAIRERLRGWLKQQPDLTLAELQERLLEHSQLRVSQPSLWVVLRCKMGLRLKKSRSTPKNRRAKRFSSSARRISKKPGRSKIGSGSSSMKPGSTR